MRGEHFVDDTTRPRVKIERQTLANAVHARLRNEILNGELLDGQELNQVGLARRFDVSRVPVREALQRLMAEGFVKGDPYRRVTVATIGAQELDEMLRLREELEVFALRSLLASSTTIDFKHARDLNRMFKNAADDERRIELDQEIHAVFMGATPVTARLVADLRNRSQRYLGHVRGGRPRRLEAAREHERILAAVEAADEAASLELLRTHINVTRAIVTDSDAPVAQPN
jgi:DNA-binding GntR family transcriptional regulator